MCRRCKFKIREAGASILDKLKIYAHYYRDYSMTNFNSGSSSLALRVRVTASASSLPVPVRLSCESQLSTCTTTEVTFKLMPATRKKHDPFHFPPTIRCTLPGCSRMFKSQSGRARHEYSAHPTSFLANSSACGHEYESSPIRPIRAPSPQLEALLRSSELPSEGHLESGSDSYDYDISMLTQDISMLSIGRDELLQDLDRPDSLSHSVTGSDSGRSEDLDSDIGDYKESEDNLKVYHRYLNGARQINCSRFTVTF